ncbi:unnamed protein product [Phytophthora fragariaefolia]|uniref:Unnamed protein product n=1 Tax=Phytophthora fragariaefolia TaxID=1490495 RepID=A0A9W6XVX7_9STRA|nr:unnamed protein product [Phytophthora fragariaefolia]
MAKKRAHISDRENDSGSSEEEIEVSVPPISGEFSSWEAFHEELGGYEKQTHQLYKIRSTNSVADRNKQRTAAAQRAGTSPILFDESLVYYTKTLIGTHGWSFKPRGKGSRTNHNIRSIECPAKITAVLKSDGANSYQVRVSRHMAVHNHDVGSDVYYTYAEARKITFPGTHGIVKTLVQGNVGCWTHSVKGTCFSILIWLQAARKRRRYYTTLRKPPESQCCLRMLKIS